MTSRSSENPCKKRKKQNSVNVITVGSKPFSLEGYLNPAGPHAGPNISTTTEAAVAPGSRGHDKMTGPSTSTGTASATANFYKCTDKDGPSQARKVDDTSRFPTRRQLPIWKYRDEIRDFFCNAANNVLILVGETGSGKSTQVPQFLYQEPWCRRQKVQLPKSRGEASVGGTIAVTQPRRVAAMTLAHRLSNEVGTPLSQKKTDGLVGYSVRFEHHNPRGTKIKFVTEGILLQEFLRDPFLRQYSVVVVDEIHERSLDVDLLVGMLKQILNGDLKGRAGIPLKVVIMSATADVDVIRNFFEGKPPFSKVNSGNQVKVIRIEGRQFPVQVVYEPQPVPNIQEALLKTIFKIHTEEPLPGDILAFLTGQEEIESMQQLIDEYATTLASNVPKIEIRPLYGQLSMEGQQKAFLPVKARFTRKIILATNIAETSVTVPGVRFVVDCGKAKVKQYRPRLGMESLLSTVISKSSALQRAGRAGREGPGKCYRLYTESTFEALQRSDLPEILRNDVLGAVLTMKARGIDDVLAFPLMDAPSTESIEKALLHLHFLGAVANDGVITSQGEQMARLPIPAPFGAVLLNAAKQEYDCVIEIIDIISCITAGDDIFLHLRSEEAREEVGELRKEIQRREGDVITLLTTMQRYTSDNVNRKEWCEKRRINCRKMRQALKIRRQLRDLCVKAQLISEAPPPDPQPFTPLKPDKAEAILKCFMQGFAMKTAMLAPDGSYVTVQGKHAVAIHPSSVLYGQKREAIMFLEHVFTTKNYAKKVSAIRADWITKALEYRYQAVS